jgi:hypothetical protein
MQSDEYLHAFGFDNNCRRHAFLVANNVNLLRRSRLNINQNDTLIQFNKSLLFDEYKVIRCHKIHVFNVNELGSYWGFSTGGTPSRAYDQQNYESLTFVFVDELRDCISDFVKHVSTQSKCIILPPEATFRNFNYPLGKHPSVGFTTALLMLELGRYRKKRGGSLIQQSLLGFTGKYPAGHGYEGHDFEFEQMTYRRLRLTVLG